MSINFKDFPKSAKEARLKGRKHYYTGKRCKNGHLSLRGTKYNKCLACDKERHARRYNDPKNYDHLKLLREARYKINKDKINSKRRALYRDSEEYKNKVNEGKFRSKYGIDYKRYSEILAIQNSKCAICKGSDFGRKGLERFLVDHCHRTGKVRGLVCNNCNSLLGFSNEDADVIRAAIKYLTG